MSNGKTLLIVNGYTFRKEVALSDGTRWRCNEPSQTKYNNDDQDNDSDEYLSMLQTVHNEESVDNDENVAIFVESRRGKVILQYNGFRYRKAYNSKHGARWNCSVNKQCGAFVYLNDNEEIIMLHEEHIHSSSSRVENVDANQKDTAMVITSRKGKEMLLFRQFTYRKQYDKGSKARWVCSTLKNCHACVFTDDQNFITSAFEQHCHPPPKYYLKPHNVLRALRQPLIIETE